MKNLDFLMHGIDFNNGTVDLSGTVDVTMYRKVCTAISMFSHRDRITYMLNTYGGELYQAFAIYDILKSYEHTNVIICNGPVMSAGTIILQGAHRRLAMPNAQFLIHYGEDASESALDAHHNAQMLKKMKDILQEKVNVKRQTINRWFHKDTYISAEHALKIGLVDEVLSYEKN